MNALKAIVGFIGGTFAAQVTVIVAWGVMQALGGFAPQNVQDAIAQVLTGCIVGGAVYFTPNKGGAA